MAGSTVASLAATVAQYRANERLTSDQLRARNADRFRELARFVREHSTYYRRSIDER
jgi:phenylacetate-coenzyme A ligase PaaK-like adenylate-forming protein